MYTYMNKIFGDIKGGTVFVCFEVWHICYIVLFVALAIWMHLYLQNKSAEKRKSVIETFINIAFGLYIADFFLMPFAYGEITIEKLPFHVCTTMCVMCFLSRRVSFLKKFKLQFAMLGMVSNFVYLMYPAGVMWKQVHPLSYRVIQTLFFHGVMAVYGFLVLVYERDGFAWKKCYRDLITVSGMTLWALFGNTLYNNDLYFHNWFFVVQDPFNMFPQNVSPFIMPFLNVAMFFGVEMLLYWIVSKTAKPIKEKV